MSCLCPVCGYPDLDEPAWNGTSPSDDICTSCGTQFGYDDFATDPARRTERHRLLRQRWRDRGCPWYAEGLEDPPPGWDPDAQLARLALADAAGQVLRPDDVEALWERFDREAQSMKSSLHAVERLADLYARLDDRDRPVADELLTTWIRLELDARRWFDALALIRRFEVRSALPALHAELASLDGDVGGPAVRFERAKLQRIIETLEGRRAPDAPGPGS